MAKRRTKAELDPALLDKIVTLISVGVSKTDAAQACGIRRQTIRNYELRGAAGEEPFATWIVELSKAQMNTKVYVLTLLQKAAKNDWKAGAWLLEKLHPKEFGKRVELEHSGKVEQKHDLSKLTREELMTLRNLKKKITTKGD